MKFLFGPINSRRLGVSLGIDLVPFKTCTLDCVYCECGATTNLTGEIKEYVPTNEVISELDSFLKDSPALDCITFSGSGEPTLHSGIGTVIGYLKKKFPVYPVVVLTNGTLLWKGPVRAALSRADRVIPSLDAVSDDVFNRLVRPVPGITVQKVLDGLKKFKQEYSGILNLEVFIVPGVNDFPDELQRIRDVCLDLAPHSVQLNKLDRPGTESSLAVATYDSLYEIADFFAPLTVEVIGKPNETFLFDKHNRNNIDSIREILMRRPSTLDDLAGSLAMNKSELVLVLDILESEGVVEKTIQERGIFYKLRK